MNGKMLTIGAVLLTSGLMVGCSSGGGSKTAKAPTIQEEWLARVPQSDLAQVEQARAAKRMAQDELTRSEVEKKDAENELKVQQAQLDAAKSKVKAGEANLKAAKQTGEQSRVSQAQNSLDEEKLGQQVGEQRIKVAQARIDAADSRQKLAKARVGTHDVRVTQAEYNTLRQQGDTRVQNIDPAQFDKALTEQRAKEAELEKKLSQSEQKVLTAERELQQKEQQLQARQPMGVPAG